MIGKFIGKETKVIRIHETFIQFDRKNFSTNKKTVLFLVKKNTSK